jgi:hypothetical protein
MQLHKQFQLPLKPPFPSSQYVMPQLITEMKTGDPQQQERYSAFPVPKQIKYFLVGAGLCSAKHP